MSNINDSYITTKHRARDLSTQLCRKSRNFECLHHNRFSTLRPPPPMQSRPSMT
jgi:hypothetical protein